ncbi:MAG: methylmalonyl-CoA decarboxylase [Bacteroidales bacterium]|nr:methylmalonyl-CoA decarboxylase [Bacteroidales bacterium]
MIKTEKRNKTGIVSLNHPEKLNALSQEMVHGLVASLESFKEDKMRVIIIRAEPNKSNVWSAGHYIPELPENNQDPLGFNDPLEVLLRAIQRYPGPVITQIHGSVWGGACDLIMTSDISIGDTTTTLAITPAKLGVPYNASGICHFIARLGINQAKEMFFTARPIDAVLAERWGVINHIVEEDQLEAYTMEMAEHIATLSPLAISVIKEQFRILSNSQALSADVFEKIEGLRTMVWESNDYHEGIKAFREKRKPEFKGE